MARDTCGAKSGRLIDELSDEIAAALATLDTNPAEREIAVLKLRLALSRPSTKIPIVVDPSASTEWVQELNTIDEGELDRRDRSADRRWASASTPKGGRRA